jgi:hypothetical protein
MVGNETGRALAPCALPSAKLLRHALRSMGFSSGSAVAWRT